MSNIQVDSSGLAISSDHVEIAGGKNGFFEVRQRENCEVQGKIIGIAALSKRRGSLCGGTSRRCQCLYSLSVRVCSG